MKTSGGNILLTREEWDEFNRRINTYDPEREKKVNTLFKQFHDSVNVRESDGVTTFEIPWLSDEEMQSLLGLSKGGEQQ